MRKSRRPLVIASRRSRLARAQAESVGHALAALDPSLTVQYRWIESEGDQRADQPLARAGGKGLFVRSIEKALLDGQADLAVHSAKDLPARETPGLIIAAVPQRADVRDCLVSASGYPALSDLPQGAVIGTASPRRGAQLLRIRPDLKIQLLRGNIETRLGKVLQEKTCDASLMAVAGLQRAGLGEHARHVLGIETMLPAACQGALAMQCRSDDHVTLLRCLPLNHAESAAAVHAERQIVLRLQGDCDLPIAVLVQRCETPAQPISTTRQDKGMPHFMLWAKVWSADGTRQLEAKLLTPVRHVGKSVKKLVAELHAQGVSELLTRH